VQAEPVTLPASVVSSTAFWLHQFATDWVLETPLRIHTRAIGDDGAPAWHHDFGDWLDGEVSNKQRNPERRLRTTRAFRRLRRVAVREYEVLYRMVVLGNSVEQVADWLNERAIRNGKNDRYGRDAVLILVVSGVDKVVTWW
jgi:hypothetical protein